MSRYQSDPGVEHWTAVNNILKYLYKIKDMFLIYGGDEELAVKGYADASFNTDPNDSNSVRIRLYCRWRSARYIRI
jgi:hypothetical protein